MPLLEVATRYDDFGLRSVMIWGWISKSIQRCSKKFYTSPNLATDEKLTSCLYFEQQFILFSL